MWLKLLVVLVCALMCAATTYGVSCAVMQGYGVFIDLLHSLPQPRPWVPLPEPQVESAGEPIFERLLRQIPKPVQPPFYAPRGRSADRDWPSGFYRDPEPEPPTSDATPEPVPEPLITIPQPDVDCEPAVYLVNQMRWACLDDSMENDAPPTIEPPVDYCDFHYCPDNFHSRIIGVF